MQKPGILAPGLKVAIRHWRALVWTYALQFAIAAVFSLRLHMQLRDLLDHSLAAQRLASGFDLGVLAEPLMRISKGPSGGSVAPYAGIPIFALLYLLLTAGTLFVYQSNEKARLSTLLSTGLRYFWRFIRLLLIAAPVSLLILGALSALRTHWLTSADKHGVIEEALFIRSAHSGLVLLLVVCALRLYFDLTEVYTVQLGLRDDRRIRKSLAPAWRVFRHNFARAYGSFLLIAALAAAAFAACSRLALPLLPTRHVGSMFLLGQIGIFLLLASRFWQRGMETALAEANPIPIPAPVFTPDYRTEAEPHPRIPADAPIPEDAPIPADAIPDLEPEPPYFPPSGPPQEDAAPEGQANP